MISHRCHSFYSSLQVKSFYYGITDEAEHQVSIINSERTVESLLRDLHKKCRTALPHMNVTAHMCFIPMGGVARCCLDAKIRLNSKLWNTLYCGSFHEHRLLKAKHSREQVKKKKERNKRTLESSTNSDGLFIRGKLRYTKLCLLDDGRGRN